MLIILTQIVTQHDICDRSLSNKPALGRVVPKLIAIVLEVYVKSSRVGFMVSAFIIQFLLIFVISPSLSMSILLKAQVKDLTFSASSMTAKI